MDNVWDTYKAYSIKDSTREKRGNGQRRNVTGETKTLPNCNATEIKLTCFALLTSRVSNFQFPENKEVNITSAEFVEALAICRDVTMKKFIQELLYMRTTRWTKDVSRFLSAQWIRMFSSY